jgi:carboxypeptidase family protein
MKSLGLCLGCLVLMAVPGRGLAEDKGVVLGRVTDAVSGAPIEGATVILTGSGGAVVAEAHTGAAGTFAFGRLAPGSYDLLAIHGHARSLLGGIRIDGDQRVSAAPTLDMNSAGETIVIHERAARDAVPPRVIASTNKPLPYSDAAVDEDVWGLGWVLLTIDERGRVTAAQYLERPGHGLDDIGLREAFKLRFAPARDGEGRAVASTILWRLEWPAYWWQKDVPGHTRPPPCAGSGPLPLEYMSIIWGSTGATIIDRNPLYRDCTPPDLTRAATEPVVRAP